MPNTANQIQARVDAFVDEMVGLIQEAAFELVQGVLASSGVAAPARRGPGRPRKAKAAKRATAKKTTGKRGRRSSVDVDAIAERVVAYVRSHDGCNVAAIGKALRRTTTQLRLPLQKVIASGQLRTTGQKRGTRYHAGKGLAVSKKSATRKKAGRKKAAKKATTKKAVTATAA